MSCLLPQFKCQPDTFSVHFRTHQHQLSFPVGFQPRMPLVQTTIKVGSRAKHKEPNCFRAQCLISTTSPSTSTAILDLEKPRSPSIIAHSDSAAGTRPWTFTEAAGAPNKATFGAALAKETLITSDDAVIAAAAAEAVILARAAVKFARDAAFMVNSFRSEKTETKHAISSTTETLSSMWSQLTQRERADILGYPMTAETRLKEECSTPDQSNDFDYLEPNQPADEEIELLSDGITVNSRRQNERKVKRVRAAEKAAANVVSVKAGSASKRKRGSFHEVDYTDPLRYLRGTTSTSRLLNANEEMELSEGIQDLLKLERLQEELADRCGGQPTFAQWAAAAGVDRKTLRKRLNDGVICKDKMIKCNIRLVISIAKNYQGAGMNLQDLVQEGCRGLVRGAEKFDASKGFKFSTYAHWWIKQAVRKSLSDQSRTIRLPFHMVEATYKVKEARKQLYSEHGRDPDDEEVAEFHMVEATYKVKEARKQLYSEHGRDPDDEEVAEAAGLSMKRLNAVLLTPKAPRSLDQKIGLNMDLKPSEIIADPEALMAEDILMKQFMKQDLEKVLDSLSKRENQVIRWRFGLVDGRMKTLQEIGEMMGVSRERVRQIESSAFRKLKSKKRTKQLKQYLIP